MRGILSLAILCLAAMLPAASSMSAGCGKSPISSGTKSMTVNGKNRQYVLQVPANYNANTAYKLIFGYHWRGGNMNNVAPGYYGLRDLAKETAIFVAPDGLGNGWGNSGGEDVTFTDMMVKLIEDSLCVDETQIFATGWSYGGAMSYSLACSRPNVFRAVAVIAGAELSGCAGGTTPVAYLGIHGIHDSVLPISLGRGLRDKFLQLNGCASKNAPEPSQGSGTHIKTVYSCRAGYPVWWIAHDGDHVPDPADRGGQNWAPGETWTFFTQAVVGGGTGGSTGGGGSQPTTTKGSTPTTTPGTGGGGGTGNPNPSCSAKWGQCGGQGWTGPTCCESGTSCKSSNPYYSQCL